MNIPGLTQHLNLDMPEAYRYLQKLRGGDSIPVVWTARVNVMTGTYTAPHFIPADSLERQMVQFPLQAAREERRLAEFNRRELLEAAAGNRIHYFGLYSALRRGFKDRQSRKTQGVKTNQKGRP